MKIEMSHREGHSHNDKDNWSVAVLWLYLVLSILIVFLHVDLGSNNGAYLAVKQVMNVLADCAVPAFFCVSAYLAFRKERPTRYWDMLRKKAMTILLPYLLWNVLACIYQWAQAMIKGESFEFSFVALLMSEHNGALWFLRVLFGYVILAPVIAIIAKQRILSIVLIIGIIACNLFVYTFPYSSLTYWLPCYLLGAYCGTNHKNFIESDKLHKGFAVKIIPALLLGAAVMLGVLTYDGRWYYAYRMVGGLLIILCCLLQRWNRAPTSMLQNSFFTFCTHTFLLGAAKVFNRILPNNAFCTVLGYIFCAGAIWLVTAVVAEILKKYVPKVHAVLVGGRKNMRT